MTVVSANLSGKTSIIILQVSLFLKFFPYHWQSCANPLTRRIFLSEFSVIDGVENYCFFDYGRVRVMVSVPMSPTNAPPPLCGVGSLARPPGM